MGRAAKSRPLRHAGRAGAEVIKSLASKLGIRFDGHMLAKRFKQTFVCLTCIICVLSSLFVFGFIGNSATRVRREHGLLLPTSASRFKCKGDAWISILDRTADSTFLMSRSDLVTFTNQLKTREPDGLFKHQSPFFSDGITTLYCDSPTGDFLLVDISDASDSEVWIRLLTDWN